MLWPSLCNLRLESVMSYDGHHDLRRYSARHSPLLYIGAVIQVALGAVLIALAKFM